MKPLRHSVNPSSVTCACVCVCVCGGRGGGGEGEGERGRGGEGEREERERELCQFFRTHTEVNREYSMLESVQLQF